MPPDGPCQYGFGRRTKLTCQFPSEGWAHAPESVGGYVWNMQLAADKFCLGCYWSKSTSIAASSTGKQDMTISERLFTAFVRMSLLILMIAFTLLPLFDVQAKFGSDLAAEKNPVALGQNTEEIQSSLIWLGFYNGLVDGDLGKRSIAGIIEFQGAIGAGKTGKLTDAQYSILVEKASLEKSKVGWTTFRHPRLRYSISFPSKLMPDSIALEHGGRKFYGKTGMELRVEFDPSLDENGFIDLYETLSSEDRGVSYTYKRKKKNWFVVSGYHQDQRFYTKVHYVKGGVAGFTFVWPQTDNDVSERMAVAFANAFAPPPEVIAQEVKPINLLPDIPEEKVDVGPIQLVPSQKRQTAPEAPTAVLAPTTHGLNPQEVFEKAGPTIWTVLAAKSVSAFRSDGPERTGSAVAVSQNTLFTNCHTFEDMGMVVVYRRDPQDGRNTEFFSVERLSGSAKVDACFLHLNKDDVLPVIATLRAASELRVGERVYSIGSPSGMDLTLGEGLISGLRKMDGIRYVQTSAPISPGSSGGGLFDNNGNLIGITTMYLQDTQSLNFAIVVDEFNALR